MSVSLRQKAYEHIREKLLRGELRPGSRLSNRKLAQEVGVSFIPVREAIGQLVSEGFAEHRARYGVVVRDPTREELADLYDLRMALECHAVKNAIRSITPADLAELQEVNQKLQHIAERVGEALDADAPERNEILAQDRAFHLIILRAAGNSLLIKTVSDLRIMERLFGPRSKVSGRSMLRIACQEHARLIECLRSSGEQEAVQTLTEHLARGRDIALQAFDQQRTEAAAQRAFLQQVRNS